MVTDVAGDEELLYEKKIKITRMKCSNRQLRTTSRFIAKQF